MVSDILIFSQSAGSASKKQNHLPKERSVVYPVSRKSKRDSPRLHCNELEFYYIDTLIAVT